MKSKKMKLGNIVCVVTPQYNYYCRIFGIEERKALINGLAFDYMVVDDLDDSRKPKGGGE